MSNYKHLLSCWHKLEHYSPSQLPKDNDILELKDDYPMPWLKNTLGFDEEKTTIFTIYLGVFKSSIMIDFVKEYFKVLDENENRQDQDIVYASIKLNKSGQYIENTFGLSTLPWALGQLEQNKIKSNDWHRDFEGVKHDILSKIEPILYEFIEAESETQETQNVLRILDKEDIQNIQARIQEECKWSVNPETSYFFTERKVPLSKKNKKANTITARAELLNSFYVKDLEHIIKNFKGDNHSAFDKYLKGNLDIDLQKINIKEDLSVLKNTLTPKQIPDGCWPSKYSLNLMQQFAVNTILDQKEMEQSSLFSVNGPPGTGKTTLLRHVIAGIIVERAKKLSQYDKPEDAFKQVGTLFNNSDYEYEIFAPVSDLNTGGIVVASSNNGAVTNISKELPLIHEVEPYDGVLSYFKEVAQDTNEDHWGLISGALGNMKNRKAFKENYWITFKDKKPESKALLKYFKENTISDLQPWRQIVKRFNDKIQEVTVEKERLDTLRLKSEKFSELEEGLATIERGLTELRDSLSELNTSLQEKQNEASHLKDNENKLWERLKLVQSTKPHFFSYWFSKSSREKYKQRLDIILTQQKENALNTQVTATLIKELGENKNKFEEQKKKLKSESTLIKQDLELLVNAKRELSNNYADTHFWNAIESKAVQNSRPWHSPKLQDLQTEAFIIALELNEIMLLTANRKNKMISNTLAGFFEFLSDNARPNTDITEAIWSTFFLVVPVVSTAFASVSRLFNNVGAEKLPWLFIDEAGQAIPQAAAGAIWRSKKVVVVGDPLQIEPVVTVPDLITKNLRSYFNLNTHQIHPELSVQVGADRANKLGTYIDTNAIEDVWIGSPLRVHRRCIEPMFSIANKIAYNNTMFLSTPNPKELPLQFKTAFIHCPGQVINRHYCESQGRIICDLLSHEINSSGGLPNTYIITPFKEISQQLKKQIRKAIDFKFDRLTLKDSKIAFKKWVDNHVGTIHTFQGKQADGVILCLGLDERTKGAANWASKKPNILNVALTRAKYKFVAIGDENIWLEQPYFMALRGISHSNPITNESNNHK